MPTPIHRVRNHQGAVSLPDETLPPKHEPHMLLIGCVDARLDIIADIGIPKGEALIHRQLAAFIPPFGVAGSLSVNATLEFAVNVQHVPDIVVMGHTDCGGINACVHEHHHPGSFGEELKTIETYLSSLNPVRDEVIARGGGEKEEARAMEQAAVRMSIEHLKSYPEVQKALEAGKLRLHGWVINTATGRIYEMDQRTGDFAPMQRDAA